MNEQPKNKVLLLIIACLLITNIVLVAFFLMDKKEKKPHTDRNAYVKEYLEKEIGFSKEQMNQYENLSKQHREQVKAVFKEIAENRKTMLPGMASAGFSDSAINSAANNIHDRQRNLELGMLRHLREIRNICTDSQRPRFDTGCYKIFGRRVEGIKRK